MPENPPSLAAQNAPNPPIAPEAAPWGVALATAAILLVSVLPVYLALRPPLFNYDGYIYRLEAIEPADGANINPHHLIWYPVQRGIAAVASCFGSPSTEAFQLSGILINSLALALFCLLLVRLTRRVALSFFITIFIAFSPRIWNLGFQNQPYPLLDLSVVAFLWTLAPSETTSRLRLTLSAFALAVAVLLQQGMALVVPFVAVGYFLAGTGSLRQRVKIPAIWAGGTGLAVAAAYALMAYVAGVKPAGFVNWTLMYLQEQHGIQLQWPQSAIKSVIGMASTLVESSWIRDRFNPQDNHDVIWWAYGALLVAACAAWVAMLAQRRLRDRFIGLIRSNRPFTSALMLLLAWGAFVFIWEPTGYYWSVNLFPLAFMASGWVRESGKKTAILLGGVLVAISGWNVYANHRQDQAYSVNFPPPLLRQIQAQLGPHDVFIVAGRDWYANRDYSLLLACLDNWPRDPALPLLDDYVLQGSREQWQQKLGHDIQDAFANGGRVYVADHVFWPDSYIDIEQTADPFSEYAHLEYAGLHGKILADEIRTFFSHYKLRESSFKVGTDPFWEVKRAD